MTVLKSLIPLTLVALVFAPWGHPVETEISRATGTVPAAKTFVVDSGHSTVLFRIQHASSGMFWGRFNEVKGRFRIDPEAPKKSFIEIEIPTASIDTNAPDRDKHMKSPEFFAAKEFPKLTFKSTKITAEGKDVFTVTGELMLRGKKKEITFEARHTGSAEVMKRFGFRTGYEAELKIKRSEFGMDTYIKEKLLGDEVKILVSLEGMLK